ncbi:MAG: DUF2285 domain-containing protein [Alphaproteobacteria bacterium]|nr:DUF2285 domain-containing protein [Alphaproteobacteria bacterium]MDE2493078.1 DUF2285 domain-containing protein [Alphaproteobacteria bacterium]
MVPRPRPCKDPEIANSAPDVSCLTDYDYRLLVTYLRLLDAEREGADWHEVARIVLKTDPDRDYRRAKRCYDSHLARAHWMTEHGYRHLLREADDEW